MIDEGNEMRALMIFSIIFDGAWISETKGLSWIWASSAWAPSTPTVNTFDDFPLFQFGLGHSADAVGGEVGVPGLDAPETAETLVALFLPLGDQIAVRDLVLDTVFVELWKKKIHDPIT